MEVRKKNPLNFGRAMFRKLVLGLIVVCVPVLFGPAIPAGGIEAAPLVTEEWVVRYNGPKNAADATRAMAVDADGNVYVTGHSLGSGSGTDFATVKYDAAGNELWVARYNGPGNAADSARAMALDADGDVYVTGKSTGIGTFTDYATVKYDGATGTQLWVARYNGPGNFTDDSYALRLDADGNVFVTGESVGSGTNFDYATVKYDGATGTQLWVARYDMAKAYDRAEEMSVDAAGNVYVSGESRASRATFHDYATVKYDGATGAQLWVARYDGPGNSSDKPYGMALGADGSVYVTGKSSGSGPGAYFRYATVKYDGATGAQLWVARYDGPGKSYDNSSNAMALDADDNVYVTGRSSSRSTNDSYYTTIKYDSAGNELWVARYNGPANAEDTAIALAVDAGGNVYVTGGSTGLSASRTNYDYATVKYDGATGAQLWVARYNGPGNFYDMAWAVVVDASENVYVTGHSVGAGTSGANSDYTTIKYSQPPSQSTSHSKSGLHSR